MTFTNKFLHTSRGNMGFIKGATLFFLGMTCVMFATQAFNISPIAKNAQQLIQKIILTVDGSAGGATGIYLNGASGNGYFSGTITGTTICLAGDSCKTAWPTAGGDSVWTTGSSKIYYIAGNVGIGTDEPTEKFQVGEFAQIGDGTANSTGGRFLRLNGQTTSSHGLPQHPSNIQLNNIRQGTTPFTYQNRKIENNGTLKFDYATGTYDYDTKLSLSSAGLMTLDGNIKLNTSGYISATPANYNQIYLGTNGNVGIGTGTPQAKLHVAGSGQFDDGIIVGGATFNNLYALNVSGAGLFSTSLKINGIGYIGASLELSSDSYNGFIEASENLYLKTDDGSTTGLSILSDGKVGIGTDTPAAKLHVKSTSPDVMTLERDSISAIWGFRIASAGTFSLIQGTTERLSILSNGRVGIGTDDPQSTLGVNGTIHVGSTNDQKILLQDADYIHAIINDESGKFYIQQNQKVGGFGSNKKVFTILANGNVGIGEESPSTKLEVNGTIKSTNGIRAGIGPWGGDPCTDTTNFPTGTMFYSSAESTNGGYCFCNENNEAKELHSPISPCTYN